MIVMSASDAKAYCLGIAQLIPVLLIALFVVDNSWITKVRDDIQQKASSIRQARTKAFSQVEETKHKYEQELKEIEKELAALDETNEGVPGSRQYADMRRAQLVELRTRKTESISAMEHIARVITEFADNKLRLRPFLQASDKFAEAADRLLKDSAEKITIGIFFGLVGEIMALWGALGLVSSLFTIALGTAIAILIAGGLCFFAIARLLDYMNPSSKLSLAFMRFSIPIIITLTLLTFIWILTSVTIARSLLCGSG